MVRPHSRVLIGSAAASGAVGPWAPNLDRNDAPIKLELWGVFVGTVQVLRSTDDGVNKLPLRIAGTEWAKYTAPGVEEVWDETDPFAKFWISITLTSGTVNYRLAQ